MLEVIESCWDLTLAKGQNLESYCCIFSFAIHISSTSRSFECPDLATSFFCVKVHFLEYWGTFDFLGYRVNIKVTTAKKWLCTGICSPRTQFNFCLVLRAVVFCRRSVSSLFWPFILHNLLLPFFTLWYCAQDIRSRSICSLFPHWVAFLVQTEL